METIYSVTYAVYDGELYIENRIFADREKAVSEFNSSCVSIVNDLYGYDRDEEYTLDDCKQFFEGNTTEMENGDLFFSIDNFDDQYKVSLQVFTLQDGEFRLACLAN